MADELNPVTPATPATPAEADAQLTAPADAPADATTAPVTATTTIEPPTQQSQAEPQAEPQAEQVATAVAEAPQVAVGRIVHVTLDRGANTGDCRPAIVVRVWNADMINVQMFTDSLNDHLDYASGMAWLTSLRYAKPIAGQPTPPRTWHWSRDE